MLVSRKPWLRSRAGRPSDRKRALIRLVHSRRIGRPANCVTVGCPKLFDLSPVQFAKPTVAFVAVSRRNYSCMIAGSLGHLCNTRCPRHRSQEHNCLVFLVALVSCQHLSSISSPRQSGEQARSMPPLSYLRPVPDLKRSHKKMLRGSCSTPSDLPSHLQHGISNYRTG